MTERTSISSIHILLIMMNVGLLPVELTQDECKKLEEKFGNNWFSELGYTEENGYERNKFDKFVKEK